MMTRRLESLDLNLLLALHWLLSEESVTAAADRLGLSQPAVSRALAKLRDIFGDPLLVKSGARMELTPQGEALRPAVARAIDRCRDVLRALEPFKPETASGRFRVACPDYVGAMVARAWAATVRREAPGIGLDIVPPSVETARELTLGTVDLCIVPQEALAELPPSVRTDDYVKRRIGAQPYACAVRRGHPIGSRSPSLQEYAALDHVLVNPGGTPFGTVDEALSEHGLSRYIAYTTSSFLLALPIVRHTDCVVTGPAPLIDLISYALHVFEPPLEVAPLNFIATWHPNWTNNLRHRYLRGKLISALSPDEMTAANSTH